MKKTSCINLALLVFTSVIGSFLVSCDSKSDSKGGPYSEASSESGLCETSWFPHNQTPAPAEGNGSPFDTSSTTNSIFHQWSWQKFLWLTKPMESGKALFEEELVLVDNHMMPVAAINGVSLVLEDIGQAGSGGILISNSNFNSDNESDTVYYAIYVNDILQNAADSLKNIMLEDTTLLNNRYTFPVGACELKVAWINEGSIADDQRKNYYTSEALIKSTGEKTTVALLGMHVVGVVKNHPEFIWATFEHKDMAPYYDWAKTTDKDVPVTSNDEKLFFMKEPTVADIKWNKPKNVFTVFKYGVPRVAKDSFMVTSQKEPENYNNISSINACVATHLDDVWNNYFYNGSIWIDTDGLTEEQQADTIVALGNSIGKASPGSRARGSLAAFNITMETFVQTFTSNIHSMKVDSLMNCLSCHSSVAKITLDDSTFPQRNSPLYISHIFRSYLSKSSGVSKEKIEALRTQEFINLLNAKSKDTNQDMRQ